MINRFFYQTKILKNQFKIVLTLRILKKININNSQNRLSEITSEADQLKKLENPFFIKHFDFFNDGSCFFFVTDYFNVIFILTLLFF
jgi:hypothetical protein